MDRPCSPTAATAQSGAERPIDTCVGLNLRTGVLDLPFLARRLRIPEIDVKTLDLFDQQEDRLSGRPKIVIAVGMETRAPGAELLDLGLVQTIAQRSPSGLDAVYDGAEPGKTRPEANARPAEETVLRVPLAGGVAWFKDCAPVQAFEPRLSAELFSRWPDRVAHVLGHDEERAWLLLADAGTPIGTFGNPPEAWLAALPQYAELQGGEVEARVRPALH